MSVRLRPATEDDVPAIHAVVDRHARIAFGEPELDETEIRSWFQLPRVWLAVAERGGELVGYMDVAQEDGHFNVDTRPLEAEVAPVLVAAAEEYARGRADAPVLRGFVQGNDPFCRPAFEAAGWRPIRYSFQMRIELTDDIAGPRWREGLTVRTMRPGEEERVCDTAVEAFADHWDFRPKPYEEWYRLMVDRPRFDPHLWWLVEDGDELVATALNSWHFSGDPQFGWVDTLGVRPRWRRQGIATALLLHSFRDFRDRGATRVGLGVDGENTTGAVGLYEQVGMHVVRRNDTYEKTL
jgi:ribosomal protein S18 acetylase RimI-like enzyme